MNDEITLMVERHKEAEKELMELVRSAIEALIVQDCTHLEKEVAGLGLVKRIWKRYYLVPLLSGFGDDCSGESKDWRELGLDSLISLYKHLKECPFRLPEPE
jgi:hypothetical protein